MMPIPDGEHLAHIVARNNAEIAALRQHIAMLKEALRDVEWVMDPETGDTFCPACEGLSESGHRKNCGLTAALNKEKA